MLLRSQKLTDFRKVEVRISDGVSSLNYRNSYEESNYSYDDWEISCHSARLLVIFGSLNLIDILGWSGVMLIKVSLR